MMCICFFDAMLQLFKCEVEVVSFDRHSTDPIIVPSTVISGIMCGAVSLNDIFHLFEEMIRKKDKID